MQRVQREQSNVVVILVCEALAVTVRRGTCNSAGVANASLTFTQAPAPPLGTLVTGHVRELQLLLAQFWNVVFWLIRRGFQQEVFFITERAGQDRARV